MYAPLIGITTERNDNGDYLIPGDYVDAVRRAGGIPLLIPNGEPNLATVLDTIDGLILSGGGDIDPAHYGSPGHDAVDLVDAERDATEIALARIVAASDMPAFGVCRGAQVLNVALGGTLVEHLPDEVGDAVVHRQTPPGPIFHPIVVEQDSKVGAILGGAQVEAASWHHQAIRSVAPGLNVVAVAPDGTIEAVEMPSHPWLVAVQWHPEISASRDTAQQRLFDAFIQAARQRRQAQLAASPILPNRSE